MANTSITPIGTVEFPIWKDLYSVVPTGANEYVGYRFMIDSNYVYQGYTYTSDGSRAYIYPKKVMKDYVRPTLDLNTFGIQNNNAHTTAYVTVSTDSFETEDEYATYKAYYDYSYEDNDNTIISDPILTTIDPRQRFTVSARRTSQNNTTETITVTFNPTGTSTYSMTPYLNTVVANIPYGSTGIQVTSGTDRLTYTVKETCKPYCLYYMNRLGGWDTLVLDGKESAQMKNNQYKKEYINLTNEHNNTDYLRQKTRKWQLVTPYLTDRQSKKMKNVLDSTLAYLQVFDSQEIIPVNISNNQYEVKTYRNQKRKLYTYTIEATDSRQQDIR